MFAQKLAHEIAVDRVDLEALDKLPEVGPLAAGEHDAVRSRRLPHRDCRRAGNRVAERMAAADLGRRRRRSSPTKTKPRPSLAPSWAATTRLSARSRTKCRSRFPGRSRRHADRRRLGEGFLQAIMLRADAWDGCSSPSGTVRLLFPILALCGDERRRSLLGLAPDDEEGVMEEAVELIPACVIAIAAYWRAKGRSKSPCRSLPARRPSLNALQPKSAVTSNVLAVLERSSKNAAAKSHKLRPSRMRTRLRSIGC